MGAIYISGGDGLAGMNRSTSEQVPPRPLSNAATELGVDLVQAYQVEEDGAKGISKAESRSSLSKDDMKGLDVGASTIPILP